MEKCFLIYTNVLLFKYKPNLIFFEKYMTKNFDVIIIGGGAAGFFAAINCAINYPKYKIAILEKNSKVLQKVLISGGGRCNVTNHCLDNRILVQNYPRGQKELLSVFNQFNVSQLITWFEDRSVNIKLEPDGRMFPATNSSQTIIDCFLDEVQKLNILVLLKQNVKHVFNHDTNFEIICDEDEYQAKYVIATNGGFHKLEHYTFLQQLEHKIVKPIPSLFTFNITNHILNNLMGVAAKNVVVKILESKHEFVGDLLITHWGFSGPAVLKLSSFAAIDLSNLLYNYTISINWINEKNNEAVKNTFLDFKDLHHLKNIENALPFDLPKRLWNFFFEQIQLDSNTKWAEVPNKKINALVEILCNSKYKALGKTTNKEEFVTSGGVDLKDVDMKTMQSKKVKNLFFAGEVLNIDGITGGFNFQSAWSTAYVAAQLNT